MGKWINAFIGTIVVLFIVVSVGVFAYLMVVNPPWVTDESESDMTRETETNNEPMISPEKEQEVEDVVNKVTDSFPEYQITNEVLDRYTTEEILDDILDNTTTEIDRRVEYHSMTEPKDGTSKEQLLYSVGEMEYEVIACEENRYPTDLDGLVQYFRYDLEFVIKDGYAKDPSITPILQRAKDAIVAYSECEFKN